MFVSHSLKTGCHMFICCLTVAIGILNFHAKLTFAICFSFHLPMQIICIESACHVFAKFEFERFSQRPTTESKHNTRNYDEPLVKLFGKTGCPKLMQQEICSESSWGWPCLQFSCLANAQRGFALDSGLVPTTASTKFWQRRGYEPRGGDVLLRILF